MSSTDREPDASGHQPEQGGRGDDRPPPRDLLDCLKELAAALQARGMYPEGHPARNAATVRLLGVLESVLDRRGSLVVQGHRTHLSVEGHETGPGNPLLESLARRLHAHQLLALEFEAGLDDEALSAFLDALAREPDLAGDPLGAGPADQLPDWPGLHLRPLSYDPLRLRDDEDDETGGAGEDLPASFEATLAGADVLVHEPEAVADEIEERLDGVDAEVEEEVADRLLYLVEASSRAQGEEAEELQRRLSRTILTLDAETLARLLELSQEVGQESQLLRSAADAMDVQAVVALVKAAADHHDGGMADWLLRLLSKLTMYETGPVEKGQTAGSDGRQEMRETVERILEGWGIDDPRPVSYGEDLQELSQRPPLNGDSPAEPRQLTVEPERVLMMGLELDEAAPAVRESADTMVGAGRFEELTDLLQQTPAENRVGRLLWGQLSVPEVIESLLEEHPPRFDLLERIVIRSGPEVAPVLLDALTGPRGKSREFRERVTGVLSEIGGPVISLVPPRLSDPRWHARRNLIGVLRQLPAWPEDFRAVPYMRDEDTRVRAEAFRAARQRPEERVEGLLEGLRDEDPRVVGLAFEAALEEEAVPPEAEDRAVELARDPKVPEGVRIRAVRVLGRLGTRAGRDALMELVWKRKWWFWRRIAAKTPVVLEALATLARAWSEADAVRPVLEAAASSRDREIREAVDVKRETR